MKLIFLKQKCYKTIHVLTSILPLILSLHLSPYNRLEEHAHERNEKTTTLAKIERKKNYRKKSVCFKPFELVYIVG